MIFIFSDVFKCPKITKKLSLLTNDMDADEIVMKLILYELLTFVPNVVNTTSSYCNWEL